MTSESARNKILTVSYGTFSCSLEGFDDPFHTMKIIAEYFRDLAADDRYFGAGSLQPDSAVMARIVQQDVSRRVEVSEHEGRIMLKAHEDELPRAAIATAEASAAAPDGVEESPTPAAEVSPEEAKGAQAELEETETVIETSGADASEKLVELTDTGLTLEEAAVAEVSSAETTDSQESIDAFFAKTATADAVDDAFEDDATLSGFPAELDDASKVPATSATAPVESISEKLQRIRAVGKRKDAAAETGSTEQQASGEDTSSKGSDVIENTADQAARKEIEDAAESIEQAFEADDAFSADVKADLNQEEDDLDVILSRIESRHMDDDEENWLDDTSKDAVEEPAIKDDTSEKLRNADDVAAKDKRKSGKARVIKVNRADFEAAIEQGELEELPEVSEVSEVSEDALDKMAQTAALKAAARDSLPDIDDTAEEGVSRLMAEAEHQMEEPEGQTRRSAFEHLRAAVAARFADRSMEQDAKTEKDDAEAYRSDLAEAVKPRRPESSDTRTARPAEAPHTAPLTLVAEQRVDDLDATAAIAPRRVETAKDDGDDRDVSYDPDTGFKNFAEDVGANELPELLEAAAAYISFVEGQEQFSRPQLMSRVRQVQAGSFSREDGLRSFGMLLRTGKIEKIRGGRFIASKDIRFKPDARAVG